MSDADITDALDKIKTKVSELRDVKKPHEIKPGEVDIDMQLLLLATNLQVLDSLVYMSGNESTRLEYEFHKESLRLTTAITEEALVQLGIVKSDRFKHIKNLLAEHRRDWDMMKGKYQFFRGMKDTFVETIQVLKKVRILGQ